MKIKENLEEIIERFFTNYNIFDIKTKSVFWFSILSGSINEVLAYAFCDNDIGYFTPYILASLGLMQYSAGIYLMTSKYER